MNMYLLLASILSGATFLLHTIAGSAENVGPLLESDVEWVPKMVHYYCWHVVSITLGFMACAYAYAGVVPDGADVAWLVTLMSIGFTVWSVGLGVWKRADPWYALPQWVCFLAISVAALVGLL